MDCFYIFRPFPTRERAMHFQGSRLCTFEIKQMIGYYADSFVQWAYRNEICINYQSPLPSESEQHQFASDTWLSNMIIKLLAVSSSMTASRISNACLLYNVGSCLIMLWLVIIGLVSTNSKENGNRIQLNPYSAIKLEMVEIDCHRNPPTTKSFSSAPYQLTQPNFTREPCKSTTYRPLTNNGNCSALTR